MLKSSWKSWVNIPLALLLVSAALLQEQFRFSASVTESAKTITADNLGNLYLLKENTLKKYTPDGTYLAEFTLRSSGTFSSIDVSDPFKILLFSQPSGHIIRLDNTLSPRGNTLQLFAIGLTDPVLACNAHDNGCWIYDQALNEILHLNAFGSLGHRTGNLSEILSYNPNPSMLLEKDFVLYAADPLHGVLLFDQYGAYLKTIPIQNIHTFAVSSGKISWYHQGEIHRFDTQNLQETTTKIPSDSCINAITEGNYLYIHQTDSISIYHKSSRK